MSGNIIAGDTLYFALLMLQANGTPDPGFATNGLFKTVFGTYNSNNGRGIGLSQDGKIVMAGWAYTNVNATCTQKYMAVSRYFGGSMATAVQDVVTNEGLLLYPNPISANRIFYLDESWGDKVTSLSLFDLNGKCVYTKEGNNHTYILPSSLHVGIYCCRIKTVSGFIVEKLMVE
jgi:hypothetical protein